MMYNDGIELLGMKLSFDDLLILGILFVLYKEEVNDTSLYIVLVMLLLRLDHIEITHSNKL